MFIFELFTAMIILLSQNISQYACSKLKSLPLHFIHRSEMLTFSSVPLTVSVITAVIRSFESTSIT